MFEYGTLVYQKNKNSETDESFVGSILLTQWYILFLYWRNIQMSTWEEVTNVLIKICIRNPRLPSLYSYCVYTLLMDLINFVLQMLAILYRKWTKPSKGLKSFHVVAQFSMTTNSSFWCKLCWNLCRWYCWLQLIVVQYSHLIPF